MNRDAVKSLRKHCEKLRSLLYKVDKSKENEDMHKVLNDLTKYVLNEGHSRAEESERF